MKRSVKEVAKVTKNSKKVKNGKPDSSREIFSGTEKFENKVEISESSITVGATIRCIGEDKEWTDLIPASFREKSIIDKVMSSAKFIGAHVGISGGIDKAPVYAAQSGCRAFGLFLRNQRTWKIIIRDLGEENVLIESFKRNCVRLGFDMKHILPHGSYLLNAGAPDPAILEKTRVTMLHEVKMCEKMGVELYNFHPGSSCNQMSTDKCLERVAETVNIVLKQTQHVVIVLETMASQGNTVGGTFEQLKTIIDMINDKTRVGVCLDTCHIFAAGYDIRDTENYRNVMRKFDEIIGLNYLKAIHLNDSKGE
uniref:Xylose isomerase-like TIM barrel domain-containing protein n=1 Tax=Romanomermis culicivorax TaxID=13658 RepID=A0A915KGS9_ROMCU